MKRLAFASVLFVLGCGHPNHYDEWISADTSIERRMEIVRCLESNGWENVGFSSWEGSVLVTATRRTEVR